MARLSLILELVLLPEDRYAHALYVSLPSQGELRHIHRLRFWPLISVLQEKYLLPFEEANKLSSFLLPMLRLHPERRALSKELLVHQWLEGVVVQGEIELAQKQQRQRLLAAAGGAGGQSGDTAMSDGQVGQVDDEETMEDALKPVGSLSTTPSSAVQSPIHLNEAGLKAAQARALIHGASAGAGAAQPEAVVSHAAQTSFSVQGQQPQQAGPSDSQLQQQQQGQQGDSTQNGGAASPAGPREQTHQPRSSSVSQSQATPRQVSSRGQGSPSPHGLPRPAATATVS